MDPEFPNADDIDTVCERRLRDDETPGLEAPRCKEEAATWVHKPDGTRMYVCRECAIQVLRCSAGDEEQELRELSRSELEERAEERGINLESPTKERLVRRLVPKKAAEDVADHPLVTTCKGCFLLTLYREAGNRTGRCLCCEEGAVEFDPEELVVEW